MQREAATRPSPTLVCSIPPPQPPQSRSATLIVAPGCAAVTDLTNLPHATAIAGPIAEPAQVGPQGEAHDGPSKPDRDASRDRPGFAGASGRSPEQERTFSRCATPQDSQLARQSSPCRNIRGGLRPRGSAAAICLSPPLCAQAHRTCGVQVAGCAATSVHDLVSDHAQRIGTNHHLIPRPQIHPGIPEIVRPEDHAGRRAGENHRARGNVSGGIE